MRFDDSTPIGPAECPNCPGQHHWPTQCQNTPAQQRERLAALHDVIGSATQRRDAARIERLERYLQRIAAATGHPSPAEGCRKILALVREAFEPEPDLQPDPASRLDHQA